MNIIDRYFTPNRKAQTNNKTEEEWEKHEEETSSKYKKEDTLESLMSDVASDMLSQAEDKVREIAKKHNTSVRELWWTLDSKIKEKLEDTIVRDE